MNESFIYDVDAYCQRIGYDGPLEPTLFVLKALSTRHVCSIPFENLDVILRRGIDLSPSALQRKLVHERRGGYCFEQNSLMLGILQQVGFEVKPLAGRVRMEVPRHILPARTHLFLNVTINEVDWICDVGVGGMSLTTPIRRHEVEKQDTLHEPRRIVAEDGRYFHQALRGSDWTDVYEFTGEEMPLIDREVANWWTSTNPNSKFSQNIFCARASDDGERLGLVNNRFVRRRGSEILEERILSTADQLLETLDADFGLQFPTGTRFGTGDRPWPTD